MQVTVVGQSSGGSGTVGLMAEHVLTLTLEAVGSASTEDTLTHRSRVDTDANRHR